MRTLIAGLIVVTSFLWVMLVTADEWQWVLDNSCSARAKIVRYPTHLGGPHPAVCNPTGVIWR